MVGYFPTGVVADTKVGGKGGGGTCHALQVGAVVKLAALSPATKPTKRGRIAGGALPASIVTLLPQIVNGTGVTVTVPITYVIV
jgi:hypothetical protein